VRKYRLAEALADGRVLRLGVLYLGLVTGRYAVISWPNVLTPPSRHGLPTIL
jgi:hypothetical protein